MKLTKGKLMKKITDTNGFEGPELEFDEGPGGAYLNFEMLPSGTLEVEMGDSRDPWSKHTTLILLPKEIEVLTAWMAKNV